MTDIPHTPKNMKLIDDIRSIIKDARSTAVRSVDFCRVQMYWKIGHRIVEEEKKGNARAEYGKYIIRNLLKELMPDYGSGYGIRQLERARQLFRRKSDPMLCRKFYAETRDGQRMGTYSRLLGDAISSLIATKETTDLFSFLDGDTGSL
ncbi:MAG: hypothetical protein K2M11_05020, partial [Paramuribaculum sp.]|nr:hypothetical protein [Paramuribaculum sp.]